MLAEKVSKYTNLYQKTKNDKYLYTIDFYKDAQSEVIDRLSAHGIQVEGNKIVKDDSYYQILSFYEQHSLDFYSRTSFMPTNQADAFGYELEGLGKAIAASLITQVSVNSVRNISLKQSPVSNVKDEFTLKVNGLEYKPKHGSLCFVN